ncbi:dimethylmenaquinone methyltransferase, partial [Achromatium sp. WMS1]
LALITEATLRLTPIPETQRTLRGLYMDIHGAASAVAAIMAQPVIPCALEFMDSAALRLAREHAELDIDARAGALLMIEVDGAAGCINQNVAALMQAATNPKLLALDVATDTDEIASLWLARKALSPTLRKIAPKKINEDVVVPVSRIPEFMERLQDLSQKYNITIVNFGHAGNGNIHVNILVNPEQPGELARAEQCLAAMFTLVLELGGTLSGEHGV